MRYSRPRLHSLTDRNSQGNCADGSAASAILDTCTTGVGISNGPGGICQQGQGDSQGCSVVGMAAYDGTVNLCSVGTVPDSTCGTGGTPISD